MTSSVPKPLFRDPVYDGAADPVLVWNRLERTWWMIYTSRRAFSPTTLGVEWIHGTDLGVASSSDGGRSWTYRGTIDGLDTAWGQHTYWAPEIIDDGSLFHMYVSFIDGVPNTWENKERHIRHYTSPDLISWTFGSTLNLSSSAVIDACVEALADGRYRMWYKDEAAGSSTWMADSDDLYNWNVGGQVVNHVPHEGPNVFRLGDSWWMLVDEWRGQRVLRSSDLESWTSQGLLLNVPGSGRDDATVGLHADVVPTSRDEASIFYFTHPERDGDHGPTDTYAQRRTSIHVARLRVQAGTLVCDRDESLEGDVLPNDGQYPDQGFWRASSGDSP